MAIRGCRSREHCRAASGRLTKTAFAISWGTLAVSIATFVIVLFVPAFKWLFPQEEGRNVVIKINIALLGYILSKVHLGIIDRIFLARGKLERLLKL